MKREIRLNAFEMNTIGHIQQGLWRHPRDTATDYLRLDHWTRLARTLEDGLFDAIFLADVLGVYDVYGASPEAAIRGGVQVPVNDPMLLVPAMAAVTEHLGFVVTGNVTYEPPYLFARRMSTLDHLTSGRMGWNIVTGYLDSAARAASLSNQPLHDDRYDRADEYMALVYELWERSWEDGAVQRDRVTGVYADPARVHTVTHAGQHWFVDGVHLAEPSPQRTPVLFQAGSSARGKRFAAAHAEGVFLNGQSKAGVQAIVQDIRAQAAAAGRDPHDVKMFLGATVVTGRTGREANEKYEDYKRYVSTEAALVHAAASMGIDLAKFDLDEPVDASQSQAVLSNVAAMERRAGPKWTKRQLIEQMVLGSRQPPLVASAELVADALIAWCDEADIDGFNLSRTVVPECFEDFGDLVVPILQERGVFKTAHGEGTLRQRLSGRDRLPASHPVQAHRAPAAG